MSVPNHPTPAGWYPDPSGTPNLRYFDGHDWTDRTQVAAPSVKKNRRWLWVIGAAVVGVIAVVAIGFTGDHKTTGKEDSVIRTCQDFVKKILKDPDSARFSDWTASTVSSTTTLRVDHQPQQGDTAYRATGNVNAKNGFGGYNGDEPYQCDAVVATDGYTYARAWPL